MVFVPLVIVAAGYTFEFLIPGCSIGGERGALGCHLLSFNLDPLFSFIGFWGHLYLVAGIGIFLLVILPAWVIIVSWKDFRRK